MNNEEARRMLLSDADFSGTGGKAKLTADALCVAVDALEKADRYRWHDLRKNPDDLPTGEKRLLEIVPVQPDSYDRYIGWYEEEFDSFMDQNGVSFNAVAWREIEMFEEE